MAGPGAETASGTEVVRNPLATPLRYGDAMEISITCPQDASRAHEPEDELLGGSDQKHYAGLRGLAVRHEAGRLHELASRSASLLRREPPAGGNRQFQHCSALWHIHSWPALA